jgi:polar amino acid transport system permease protein
MSLAPRTTASGEVIIDTKTPFADRLARFPFWLLAMVLGIAFVGLTIIVDTDYRVAFGFISAGVFTTIWVSLAAYCIAAIIGMFVGLGRVSSNTLLYNISTFYVELIRGIPPLVLVLAITYAGITAVVEMLRGMGIETTVQDIPYVVRGIIALAVTYGAFLAEIFRAGIESIGKGQMEAARSLGMNYPQAMWHVILPQAIRNVLPALGNDFVAMVKDSSLLSAIALREITHLGKQYTASSFKYVEGYIVVSTIYLVLTLSLSLLLRLVERVFRKNA